MSGVSRLLITDRAWPDSAIERGLLEPLGIEVIEAPAGDEATLCELARGVQAIACNWAKVTRRVIESAPQLRIVSRMGIGLDNIDIPTATARGIPVTNVPDYCVAEVADHALGLLLAAARRIAFFHLRTKRGEYQLSAPPPPERLAGKTLGLVGLGRIGQNLAPKARALGLNVVAHTPSGDDRGLGCPMLSLPELLARADYVSLHLPATAQTRHLFRLPQFEQMRPTAWLINTSRGALVHEADLHTALQRRLLAGACLDVFDPEPPDLTQPLFADERVILTPHAAFVSPESLIELRQRVARQVADRLAGRQPENIVNPAFATAR